MNWFEILKPEELPGDLQLVARECGLDVALKLAEKLGGINIYVSPLKSVLKKRKKEFIRENFNGANCKELAVLTGYSEMQVYRILKNAA